MKKKWLKVWQDMCACLRAKKCVNVHCACMAAVVLFWVVVYIESGFAWDLGCLVQKTEIGFFNFIIPTLDRQLK